MPSGFGRFAFEERLLGKEEFIRLAASCTDVSATDRAGEYVGNALDVRRVKHYYTIYTAPLYGKTGAVLFSSEQRFMEVNLEDGRIVGKGAIEAFHGVP